MIDFLTCVVNGMPFIQHHLGVFEKLHIPWRWHIYEGISHTPFTANTIRPDMHKNGLSIDGTTEYLELINHHPNVIIHRVNGDWDTLYLTERFQRMIKSITGPTLAWQLDVDEYWTVDQIHRMNHMFENQPQKQAAWFYCRFFVGPQICLTGINCAGNNCSYEWKRVWRHAPGMQYAKHDPPVVIGDGEDVFSKNYFSHNECLENGLIFNHYAYVLEKQVLFKQKRYAFQNAVLDWRRLQANLTFPIPLIEFINWLGFNAMVDRAPESHWFTGE
jgi:hypothetical protein